MTSILLSGGLWRPSAAVKSTMNHKRAILIDNAQQQRPSGWRAEYLARGPLLRAMMICTIAAFLGCSEKSSRLAIEGTVTLDGVALPEGKINFFPMPGTSSPTAGSSIKDGAFAVPANKGVRPGRFRVEIRAIRTSGKKIKDDLSG